MNLKITFILALAVLAPMSLSAQAAINENNLEKAKTNTVIMIGSGIAVTIAGAYITGIGAHDLEQGAVWGGSMVNPSLTDYRPKGRILLSVGTPLLAGGLALIACGARFRYILNKKLDVMLNAGYLDDGNIGLAFRL
jgi:hypothetical protein